MDVATGTTIRDETISAPTLLDATDTVIAVNIVNTKFITLTFTPDSFALSSSKDIYISSLYNNIVDIITTMLTIIVIFTSISDIATILPNKKLLKDVTFFIKPDNTPANPTQAEVIIAIDTSEYCGIFFLMASTLSAAKMQAIIAPSTGLMLIIRPADTPANDACERASPIMESLLSTMVVPIQGIIIDSSMPTINAFFINSYSKMMITS